MDETIFLIISNGRKFVSYSSSYINANSVKKLGLYINSYLRWKKSSHAAVPLRPILHD
jgi:hypothetical protein